MAFILDQHRTPDFEYYLKLYLTKFQVNPLSRHIIDNHSLPFTKVDVFDMFRFHPETLQDEGEENDLVKAIPASSKLPNGRFDTVVALVSDTAESTGLQGSWFQQHQSFEKNSQYFLGRNQNWSRARHLQIAEDT
jgi:hypothetical protein